MLRRTVERFVSQGFPFDTAGRLAFRELARFAEPAADAAAKDFAASKNAQVIAETQAEKLLEARAALHAWDGRHFCTQYIVQHTQQYINEHYFRGSTGGGSYGGTNKTKGEDRGILDGGFRPLDSDPSLVYRQARQFGLIQARKHWSKLPGGTSAKDAAHEFATWIFEALKTKRIRYTETGAGLGWLREMWHGFFIRDYVRKGCDVYDRPHKDVSSDDNDEDEKPVVRLVPLTECANQQPAQPATSFVHMVERMEDLEGRLTSVSSTALPLRQRDAEWWAGHMQWLIDESAGDSDFEPSNLSDVARRRGVPRRTLADKMARVQAAAKKQLPN